MVPRPALTLVPSRHARSLRLYVYTQTLDHTLATRARAKTTADSRTWLQMFRSRDRNASEPSAARAACDSPRPVLALLDAPEMVIGAAVRAHAMHE
jgi:hypothetical protein